MPDHRPAGSLLQTLRTDFRTNRSPIAVLALAAAVLALVEYLFLPVRFLELFPRWSAEHAPGMTAGSMHRALALNPAASESPAWGVIAPFAWWSLGTFALWAAIPAIGLRLSGWKLADLGLSARGLLSKLWIYALLYAVVIAGVLWASRQESFLQTYPFLRPEQCNGWYWGPLLAFWGLYGLQFFSVEFFFRGWLVFSLEKRFGAAAIAVMVVPYCMIHFHKPLPEALGAIIAGLVLGWLALRTRSIWGGVLLHVAIALSMDILALSRHPAGFPGQWWP